MGLGIKSSDPTFGTLWSNRQGGYVRVSPTQKREDQNNPDIKVRKRKNRR